MKRCPIKFHVCSISVLYGPNSEKTGKGTESHRWCIMYYSKNSCTNTSCVWNSKPIVSSHQEDIYSPSMSVVNTQEYFNMDSCASANTHMSFWGFQIGSSFIAETSRSHCILFVKMFRIQRPGVILSTSIATTT